MLQLDYLVLADAAEAINGKHYILGGGWDTIWAASFPVAHPVLTLALRVSVPWNDTNQTLGMEIDIIDADGQSIIPNPPGPLRAQMNAGRPPNLPQGAAQAVPLVFRLQNLQFLRPGAYVVAVRSGGGEIGRVAFNVMPLPGIAFGQPGAQQFIR